MIQSGTKIKIGRRLKGFERFRKEFTEDQKKSLLANTVKLTQIMEKYDFSNVKHSGSGKAGFLQFWMEEFSFVFLTILKGDKEINRLAQKMGLSH